MLTRTCRRHRFVLQVKKVQSFQKQQSVSSMNILNQTWKPFFNPFHPELNRGFPLEESIRIATMICRIRTFMMTTHTTNRSGMIFARFIYNQLRDEAAEIKVIWSVISPLYGREIVHQIVAYRGYIIEPNPMFYSHA